MVKSYFPSALNTAVRVLDQKVLQWAWAAGLFESPAELERCRVQKINWFAGYLFPEENPDRLELIMRFFLGLFLLDDLLDIDNNSPIIEYLEDLKVGNSIHPNSRLHSLGSELLLLHKAIGVEYAVPYERKEWYNAWLDYLEALQWEIRIKIEGTPPGLDEYRINRPKSSGVYLAILLIPQGKDSQGCLTELLEFTMARYIYLSNDLSSYEKELAIGDTLNEVIILMDSIGDTAITWVQQELIQLRNRILALAGQTCINLVGCEEWIRRLLLLAGGCEAWTAETSRYQNYINGKLGGH